MSIEISASFYDALGHDPAPNRATVIVVRNAGNWKALWPAIKSKFPTLSLESGIDYPVVFGGDEHYYLKRSGVSGAAEFKAHVLRLLHRHDRIFVFDTQRIQCLQANPDCMNDMLIPGKVASLYFRSAPDARIVGYLKEHPADVMYEEQRVSDDSLSVIATKLSARILADAFKKVVAVANEEEAHVLTDLHAELAKTVGAEVEADFLSGNLGTAKIGELARRRLATAILREVTPGYSTKSPEDPVEFFGEKLAERFSRYQLPRSAVGEIAPNLSFVVKSQRRFREIGRKIERSSLPTRPTRVGRSLPRHKRNSPR